MGFWPLPEGREGMALIKQFFKWAKLKIFGPNLQETLTKMVAELDKQDYQNWPNVQGQNLPLVEFPLEKHKREP